MEYTVPLRVAVGGNVDSGKCLGKNTLVLMHSGKTKMIQDIQIGEKVMGDDSQPRTVVSTTSGKDIMYKINMNRGGNYIVNSKHILSLKLANIENVFIDNNNKAYVCRWWENLKRNDKIGINGKIEIKDKKFYWGENKEFSKKNALIYLKKYVPNFPNYISPGTIIDINIQDYLKLSKYVRNRLYGYKVGVTFPHKKVETEPYLLGLWLGDYKNSNIPLTNISNPFFNIINYSDLEKDKKIPDIYKFNSPDVQLQILSGILDSDIPYIIKNGSLIITHKNKRLLNDLEFICRSLGMWAFIIQFRKKYYKLLITGKLDKIPNFLSSKKEHYYLSKQETLISKIDVKKIEKNIYYGISLSGNNQRFLLGDFTVTHNSSVLGVLKTGKLDDGSGSARKNIFNFPHEKESGRTSSISQKPIKVNNKKIIFFDLAGHEKYFRTTLYGISSSYPHVMLVLIESNRGILQMTKEHLISAIYLRIPIILVLTKLDIALPNKLKQNIRKIKKMMKSAGKHVREINEEKDIDDAITRLSETYVPLFKISSVKGNDINPPLHYLTDFLDKLNNITVITEQESSKKESLFVIDKSFRAEGYPVIGSGYMREGKINVNDKLFIGPVNYGTDDGYIEVTVRSIHDDDKNNVSYLRKNELGCLAIKAKNNVIRHKNQLSAGMIITNTKYPLINKFIGEVTIFSSHSTTIKVGYNTIIHCGAIRKTVKINRIVGKKSEGESESDLEYLKGGNKNIKVHFQFIRGKYFIQEGDRFIFREGNTRGSGHIVKIIK